MSIAKPAASETGDPLLLTPGPLTTSTAVKQAMVHDWGSRDAEFLRINRMVLDKIVELAASSNKCLEGVPGLGFVVCRKTALAECQGNATTLVLDLFEQAENFAKTGQYRFTPPIHVIVALGKAIEEHAAEGGVAGRGKRYRAH